LTGDESFCFGDWGGDSGCEEMTEWYEVVVEMKYHCCFVFDLDGLVFEVYVYEIYMEKG
jgi:hypothetical protein